MKTLMLTNIMAILLLSLSMSYSRAQESPFVFGPVVVDLRARGIPLHTETTLNADVSTSRDRIRYDIKAETDLSEVTGKLYALAKAISGKRGYKANCFYILPNAVQVAPSAAGAMVSMEATINAQCTGFLAIANTLSGSNLHIDADVGLVATSGYLDVKVENIRINAESSLIVNVLVSNQAASSKIQDFVSDFIENGLNIKAMQAKTFKAVAFLHPRVEGASFGANASGGLSLTLDLVGFLTSADAATWANKAIRSYVNPDKDLVPGA